ncbi:MAG TPA: alpha-2-macroglobulin family protein, partial [Thermoanaerobaculia bacterium]|nr:alpha-2-macroglobulin family protein [Thermoanaerobaculia bacterium]
MKSRAMADGGVAGGVVGGVMGGVPRPAPAAPMAQAETASIDRLAMNSAVKKEADEERKDARAITGAEPPAAPVTLRSNFSETAFWKPQLLTDKDGTVAFEFTAPDSVTSWNVWVHALTKDLRGGSLHEEAKSVKELMVRPYLPRFLREGDKAELRVVVNNAGKAALSGNVALEIFDPETNKSLLSEFGLDASHARLPFTVKEGGGANVRFELATPKRVGLVAFKVTAISGDTSDGELRPLPLLPSRVHLVQSRFVTLRNRDRKVMRFEDLEKNDDKTRIDEQMVVTVDAQLFYTVLQALPYLVNYPYECTEQTLNRFVSTGIVSSVYSQYPAVARMAREMSKRDVPLETFDAADPNRKMALEETPWLEVAKGGKDAGFGLTNVLDPRVAKADRDAALAKLRKAQTAVGGFPWWPGGPPSPYMTLYILHGFAKAQEFGVDVPKDVVLRAWPYMASHFRETWRDCMAHDGCWEFLTFLNYVASCYPDDSWTAGGLTADEKKEILDFSFKHWKQHSPYLKGYLALTLKRAGRMKDAHLVWDSVMDSAKTNEEQGTFWAPEDRSWLWYNDTIETHAFALKTLMELEPKDTRKDGLVQWLLLNKKLNQWKSTRATAEVIYSLVEYLKGEGALGVAEDATVSIGTQKVTFTFPADTYTGKKN